MRNSKLVIVILVALLCYLCLQIALYAATQKEEHTPRKYPTSLKDGLHEEKKAFVKPLDNLRDYLDCCHEFGVPAFLVDSSVLRKVLGDRPERPKNTSCHYFCDDATITEMAVMSHLWEHDEKFLHLMKTNGFSVIFYTVNDPETKDFLSLGGSSIITTHYLFHRGGHTIHQVLFFVQPAGYWWHSALTDTSNTFGDGVHNKWLVDDLDRVSLGKHAGVFDSFDVIKVTMDGLRLRAPRSPESFVQSIPHSSFLLCNRTRAQAFYQKYGKHEDEELVKSFRDANRKILSQAKSALDGLGVRFWLSSGTCLGWYRQCDSIHYSGDVDIGIWITDYHKDLIAAMEESDMSIRHIFGKESDSFELSFVNGEVKLDIFFFYEEGNTMWNGGTRASTGQKYKYVFPAFTLCWTEFLGLKVRVPCQAEQYLEANYGKDWFVPVKNWDWKSSPSNVIENGYWPQDEWDKVIQIFE